jgi:hypothetical protein
VLSVAKNPTLTPVTKMKITVAISKAASTGDSYNA